MKKNYVFKLKNSKNVVSKYTVERTIDFFGKEFILFKKFNSKAEIYPFYIIALCNYIESQKSYPFGNSVLIGYYDENNNLIYGSKCKEYIDNMIIISSLEGNKYEEIRKIQKRHYVHIFLKNTLNERKI